MRVTFSVLILSMATLAVAQSTSQQLTLKAARSENASTPKAIINIPDETSTDGIEIRYFLTGEFGGYGDFVRPKKKGHSYEIVAAVNDKPADQAKIIAYAPGCAFQTYEFHFEEVREAHAGFVCERLPRVTLQGQIVPKSAFAGHQAVVKIWYLANWDHDFFEIKDGMVQQFQVAETRLDSSGDFSVDLPDFSADSKTNQKGQSEAELLLSVVDQKTLNRLVDGLSFSEYGMPDGMLKIRPWYPKLTIKAVKENDKTSSK